MKPENENTPVVQLPDGSGCFTATIMSKEEALKLPRKERPICFRISSEIYHVVFESIGAASMQWKPIPEGVFYSEGASKVAVDLCFKIAGEMDGKNDRIEKLEAALRKIAEYDNEPIWSDDRDDAANGMLEVAREALKATA